MCRLNDFMALNANKIIELDTPLGYMRLLEYILQDCSFVHVLQWHNYNFIEIENNTLTPHYYTETFYRDKDSALEKAHEIGNNLLQNI